MTSRILDDAKIRNWTTERYVEGKGRALFASRDIPADKDVVSILDPLVISLDIPRLKDTCYGCLGYKSHFQLIEDTDWGQIPKLQTCTGCHVVRFCSKDCQTYSWKARHKHECLLFARLHPNILPNNVRAIIQLLLLRKASKLPPGAWEDLMKLESHIEKWKSRGGETWENIGLMARGTKEYSGTDLDEGTLREIFCKLLVNCFTFVTSCYDPLGLVLDPLVARANHSCNFNAFVRVENNWPRGHLLKVRALRPIARDEEVVVSYIDATNPHHIRQRELQERYFFACGCRNCANDVLVKKENIPSALNSKDYLAIEQRAFDLLAAARKDTSISGPINKLRYGIHILRTVEGWPLHRQPLASLRQQLVVSLTAAGQIHHAFLHAWIQYSRIDPLIFPERLHPIRLVHGWLVVVLGKRVETSRFSDPELPPQKYNLLNLSINFTCLSLSLLWKLHRKVKDDGDSDFAAMIARVYYRDNAVCNRTRYSKEALQEEVNKLDGHVQEVLAQELTWGDGS